MKKSVLLRGPLLTRSGYGEQARFALRSLRSREDLFDIYIHPLEWGQTSWLNEETEERSWIDERVEETIVKIQNGETFDYSLQVTIPNEWEKIAQTNIGYTAGIETTKVAHQWIEKGNTMDKIIVVSNHAKNVFENTSYEAQIEQTGEKVTLKSTTPIDVVNYPVKEYDDLDEVLLPDLEKITTEYNFISIAQMGPRKNMGNMLKWFIEEFHDDPDVGLVVKTNFAKNSLIDRDVTHGKISTLVRQFPDKKCKIYLIHGDLTDKEIHALHVHPRIQAAVLLSHGEGFGLPLFEAAYSGLPVVTTGWSGQLDFLCDAQKKTKFYNVGFDINSIPEEVVWDGVLLKESMWAYPREGSAKENMRKCIEDIKSGDTQEAQEWGAYLREEFAEEKMYEQFITAMGIDEQDFDIENWIEGLDVEEIE